MSDRATALVSVGMPVYNGGAFLREALESVRSQTHGDLDIVVVDNASTDDTAAIVERIAREDRRIRLHRNATNIGAFPNFRKALELARGAHFMWAAHDDRWEPTFIEENLRRLRDDRRLVQSVSRVRYLREGVVLDHPSRVSGTFALEGSVEENVLAYLASPGLNSRFYGLFRRDVLARSVDGDVYWGWDWTCMLRTLAHGGHAEIDAHLLTRRVSWTRQRHVTRAIDRIVPSRRGRVLPLLEFTRRALAEPHVPKSARALRSLLELNRDCTVTYLEGALAERMPRIVDKLRGRAS